MQWFVWRARTKRWALSSSSCSFSCSYSSAPPHVMQQQQQGKQDFRDSKVLLLLPLLLLSSNPLTSMVQTLKETVHTKRETKFLVQTKGKCTQVLILYTTDKLPEETSSMFLSRQILFLNFLFLFFFFLNIITTFWKHFLCFISVFLFPSVSSQMYMKILRFEIILLMMREHIVKTIFEEKWYIWWWRWWWWCSWWWWWVFIYMIFVLVVGAMERILVR